MPLTKCTEEDLGPVTAPHKKMQRTDHCTLLRGTCDQKKYFLLPDIQLK